MGAVREAWTDERLDDLNHRVDEGFREVAEEFRAVRGEISAMQRSMTATMITGFVGLAALIVTQG
jgi:hypothetical protein